MFYARSMVSFLPAMAPSRVYPHAKNILLVTLMLLVLSLSSFSLSGITLESDARSLDVKVQGQSEAALQIGMCSQKL